MKGKTIIIGMLCAVSATWAGTTITDDFNRADTPVSSDTSLIGANWKQDATSANEWLISGNYLHSHTLAVPGILYNDTLETLNANGTNFTLKIDAASKTLGAWTGAVFNYQDKDNFFMFRFKSGANQYQILKKVGGSVSHLGGGGTYYTSTNFVEDVFYTLTVSSSDDGHVFTCTIARAEGDTTVLGSVTRADSTFTAGYAGAYANSFGYGGGFDNFSLEVGEIGAPEPGIDDFNRADVPVTSDTSLLGGDWSNGAGDDDGWTIVGGLMHSHALAAPGILYNHGLLTLCTGGTNFTLDVDVSSKSPGLWSGVAFNYQDAANFYFVRFLEGSSKYQMVAMVGGIESVIVDETDAATTFAEDRFYTINVASDGPYTFDFTITEVGSSTALNPTTCATDAGGSLTGGYAALYTPHAGYSAKFDNFVLRLVVGGYAGWAAGWDVDIGAGTNDYDADGLSNLYEYGLGGDPTNALDQGTAPEFSIENIGGTNWVGYIHPQLSDPNSGLSYSLETSPDLVSGAWTNSGYTIVGTNVTGGVLDFVTNITDTVAGEKFIRLIIE